MDIVSSNQLRAARSRFGLPNRQGLTALLRKGVRCVFPISPLQERGSLAPQALHRRLASSEMRNRAEARARQLLWSVLSPSQREEFQSKGHFSVLVPGRGRFCILPCAAFNVLHIETGYCYCAAPAAKMPLWDLLLTQKLILEGEPDSFFAVANCRSEINPSRVPEDSRPFRVLQSRMEALPAAVRWTEISMIPSESS